MHFQQLFAFVTSLSRLTELNGRNCARSEDHQVFSHYIGLLQYSSIHIILSNSVFLTIKNWLCLF